MSFVRPELPADWERRILEDIDSGCIIDVPAAAEKIKRERKEQGKCERAR